MKAVWVVIGVACLAGLAFLYYPIYVGDSKSGKLDNPKRKVDLVFQREYQFLVREYISGQWVDVANARKTNVTHSISPGKVAAWTVSKWFHEARGDERIDEDFEEQFRKAVNFQGYEYKEIERKARASNSEEKELRLHKRIDMGIDQATGRPRSALITFRLSGFSDTKPVNGSILLNFDANWLMGVYDQSFIARNWDFRGKRKTVTEVLSALPGE